MIGGYHTEYSGLRLLMYLIAEFLHMVTAAFLITILFFGGWHLWGITGSGEEPINWVTAIARVIVLLTKVMAVIVFFMLVRWSWPRFRFDQLMSLAWKVMLPLGMVNLVIVAVVNEYQSGIMQALGGSHLALVACLWAVAIAAWLVAGIVAPLSTDNRPRLEASDSGYEAQRPRREMDRRAAARPLGQDVFALVPAGAHDHDAPFVLAQDHGQLPGGSAEDSQPADLSWRASPEQGRPGARQMRGLFLCATACPAHCIDIVAAESPWPDREKYPESFAIDELRCIYCGMCEEACPVDAIELTSLFDLTGRSREEMVFDKEKLLSVFDQTKDAEPMQSATVGGDA